MVIKRSAVLTSSNAIFTVHECKCRGEIGARQRAASIAAIAASSSVATIKVDAGTGNSGCWPDAGATRAFISSHSYACMPSNSRSSTHILGHVPASVVVAATFVGSRIDTVSDVSDLPG